MTQEEFDDAAFKADMLTLDEEIKAYDEPNEETKKAIEEIREKADIVGWEDIENMLNKAFGMKIKDKT